MATITAEDRARRSEQMKAIHAAKRITKENNGTAVAALAAEGLGQAVRAVSERNTRPRRNLFNGTQQRLAVYGDIPGYHMHIFNDAPGRIEQALASGYEFVQPSEIEIETSRRVVDTNSAVDNKVRYVVGHTENNEALHAYLMKIPMEFHAADQKEIQDKIAASENGMLARGGAEQSLQNSYIPNGRKSAMEIQRK